MATTLKTQFLKHEPLCCPPEVVKHKDPTLREVLSQKPVPLGKYLRPQSACGRSQKTSQQEKPFLTKKGWAQFYKSKGIPGNPEDPRNKVSHHKQLKLQQFERKERERQRKIIDGRILQVNRIETYLKLHPVDTNSQLEKETVLEGLPYKEQVKRVDQALGLSPSKELMRQRVRPKTGKEGRIDWR